MSMWLPIWPIKRTENERSGVGKPDGRLAEAEGHGFGQRLLPDYAAGVQPGVGRIHCVVWLKPRPSFTKATVNAWRGALEARGLGAVSIKRPDHGGAQAPGRGCRQRKTLVDRGCVVELRDAGASWATIAEALGVPSTTIRTAYTQAGALRKTCLQETVPSCGKQTAAGV
jgi:hypothetical protein